LLRLQSDERLIAVVRRGNPAGFEVLVSRYQSRLLAFCRHLLGSREDAEDVLQEVFTAAYNAMVADDRPINVRPWLYRIARNRCLNHLRRVQAVGVDSMDIHLSDHGASTADKVHMAEEFRLLVGDIQSLPETQRTALVLREMDALSYDQIAEAMETTVSSVKSLLVRARLSLAEAAEARMLTCDAVRMELAEVAEGLLPKASAPVRRHLRTCQRCSSFQTELKRTSRVLAALLPLGPIALLKQLAFAHIGHSAGAASSASAGSGAAGGAAVGTGAAAGGAGAAAGGAAAGGALITAGSGSVVPLGLGAIATKTAAGLAAAALVTAGAVDMTPSSPPHHHAASARTALSPGVADAAAAEVAQAPALVIQAAVGSNAMRHAAVHPPTPTVPPKKKTTDEPASDTNATKTATKATTKPDVKTDTTAKPATARTEPTASKADAKDTTTAPAPTAPPTSDGTHPQPTTSSQPGAATAANNQLTAPAPTPAPAANSSDTSSGSATSSSASPSGGASSSTGSTSSQPAGGAAGAGASSTTPTSTTPTAATTPTTTTPTTTTITVAPTTGDPSVTVTLPAPPPPTGP
jgi:RNA polymerase sigma factor (sigma-70 family)